LAEKDQIELSSNTNIVDGSSRDVKAIWPAQGGVVVEQFPPVVGVSYIETIIDPGNCYVTVLRDDKQRIVIHETISKDGKVTRQTATGIDPRESLMNT
jgi:hypothetical protein